MANPERYIRLREGSTVNLEKCLTLGEIFGLDLSQCRLVTLSACETGITSPKGLIDEYIGLPSGFLVAGSSSVVSSLWRVDDLATTLLMIKFYQNLQTGSSDRPSSHELSVAFALNSAQLWLRDSTQADLLKWTYQLNLAEHFRQRIQQQLNWFESDEQPFCNPQYWAAFCAIGQ